MFLHSLILSLCESFFTDWVSCLYMILSSQIASKFTADELHRIASILSKTVSLQWQNYILKVFIVDLHLITV